MSKTKQSIYYFVSNTQNNGGNRVVFEHVNRLRDKGYNVHLVSLTGSQPRWFPLKVRKENFCSLLFKKPDILVATFWPTVYLSLFLRAKNKFHLVQGWEEEFYQNKIVKKIVNFSMKIDIPKIVISDYLKNKIKKIARTNSKIFKVNGCAIDSIFKSNKQKSIGKSISILSVFSSFKYCKGFDVYLKVIDKLENKNYRFILVTSKKKKLNSQIKTVFNPSRKELASLYKGADIFLSTARSEGFCLPALEAMASGCPVILTNSGGITEYARNGYNAIILNKIDKIWKNNLVDKIIKNKNLRQKLIKNGLKTANKYSWEKIINELELIYGLKNPND